jgi:hypothetical protein
MRLEGQNFQALSDLLWGEKGWKLSSLPVAKDLLHCGYAVKPL